MFTSLVTPSNQRFPSIQRFFLGFNGKAVQYRKTISQLLISEAAYIYKTKGCCNSSRNHL